MEKFHIRFIKKDFYEMEVDADSETEARKKVEKNMEEIIIKKEFLHNSQIVFLNELKK